MKNNRESRFWRKYAIITGCALLAILCGLAVFYDFMAAYEKSQPNSVAHEYAKNLTASEIEEWIEESAENTEHKFNSAKEIADTCKAALNTLTGDFTCERNYASSTLNSPEYTVLRGETIVGSITLTEQDGGKYGFSQWVVSEKTASLDYKGASDITYTVHVPKGSITTLNGVVLNEAYRLSESIPYKYGSEFEKAIVSDADVYSISGLYYVSGLTCSLNGVECTGNIESEGAYFFSPGSSFLSYVIVAPTGAEIKINNVLMNRSYLTAEGIPYEYSEFETVTDTLPTYDVYTVNNLINIPSVTATYNGTELNVTANDQNLYTAHYPEKLTYSVQIKVPEGSSVTIDGISCDAYKTGKESAYPDLFENTENNHYYDVYAIGGLFSPIEDAEVIYNGEKLPATVSSLEQMIEINALYPTTDNEAVRQAAMAFAKDYFLYMSSGYVNIDYNLTNALSHVIYGTNLYTRILNSRNGVWYVTPVTSEDVKKFEITSMNQMDDGSVVCTIEFDIDQFVYDITRKHSGRMTLLVTNTWGNWKIGSMHLDID